MVNRGPTFWDTCGYGFDYQGLINAFLQVEKHSGCINKIQRIQYFEIITGECFD